LVEAPALSYYSKPPGIAYLHFLGNRIWGDTQFGIRFFAPIIATTLSIIVLRFFSRAVNSRAAFFLVLFLNATPLLAAGAILMTTEGPLALFWSASMIAGWKASQRGATTRTGCG
jgi:4-amino-4-deoxy-L-arabinose transferase-like glycosyltransferase